MSTPTFLIGYGPTPPSFSLTIGRKLSHKVIRLVEELPLGFLAGVVTEALQLGLLAGPLAKTLKTLAQHLMMEHLTQGEDILVHLSSVHLSTLSEGKNVKVEILSQSQSLTNYQST
jgi:hypothetical protein